MRRAHGGGFTLIEVLVALAIVAIGMAAVMGALGAQHAMLLDGGISAQLSIADSTGHAYKIPAHACYDATSKTGGILNFNAVNCYPDPTAPSAPTNLRIVGQ